MSIHNRMRAMVIKQLGVGKFGQGIPVNLTKTGKGVYDQKTGGIKVGPSTDYEGSGIRVNYSEFYYSNGTIPYGDFQIYLSPVLIDGSECPAPAVDDTLTFNSQKIKVVSVNYFNENSIGCGWKLQVRHG